MKQLFKDNIEYEIDEGGRDGILVFRDAPLKVCFNSIDRSTDYAASKLKRTLEYWWNDNAPDLFKQKYSIGLLSIEDIYSQNELDHYLGSGVKTSKQLPLFADDWKAKIKRNIDVNRSDTWWTSTKHICHPCRMHVVYPDGSISSIDVADYANCVPALFPKKKMKKKLGDITFGEIIKICQSHEKCRDCMFKTASYGGCIANPILIRDRNLDEEYEIVE